MIRRTFKFAVCSKVHKEYVITQEIKTSNSTMLQKRGFCGLPKPRSKYYSSQYEIADYIALFHGDFGRGYRDSMGK